MKKLFTDLQDRILGVIGKRQDMQARALSAINPIPEDMRVTLHDGGELSDVIASFLGARKVLPGTVGMVHFGSPILFGKNGHSLTDVKMKISHVIAPKAKKGNMPVRVKDQVIISKDCLEPEATVGINFLDFAVFPDGTIVLTPCESELSVVHPAPRPAPSPRALK